MSYRSDPTANMAIGNISKEWERLSDIAEKIRKDPCSDWSEKQRRNFTGIYKRLLDEPVRASRH